MRACNALLCDDLEARRASGENSRLSRKRLVSPDDPVAVDRIELDQTCAATGFLGGNQSLLREPPNGSSTPVAGDDLVFIAYQNWIGEAESRARP
jgi:hypothetical protein